MRLKHLWSTQPSCLDSAYEREAIEQGLANGNDPVFPENNLQLYYLGHTQEVSKVWDK